MYIYVLFSWFGSEKAGMRTCCDSLMKDWPFVIKSPSKTEQTVSNFKTMLFHLIPPPSLHCTSSSSSSYYYYYYYYYSFLLFSGKHTDYTRVTTLCSEAGQLVWSQSGAGHYSWCHPSGGSHQKGTDCCTRPHLPEIKSSVLRRLWT